MLLNCKEAMAELVKVGWGTLPYYKGSTKGDFSHVVEASYPHKDLPKVTEPTLTLKLKDPVEEVSHSADLK